MKPLYKPTKKTVLKKQLKNLFLCFLLFVTASSKLGATTYYFAEHGDDDRSFAEASNPATPWRSINKLNAIFSRLQPGDQVLFNRGDRFFGTIRASRSGTSTDMIVFGAYGSGSKPVLTGSIRLNNWVSAGNGNFSVRNDDLPKRIMMMTIGGIPYALGRYPNLDEGEGGYLKHEEIGSTYLNDEELSGTPNWTGGEVVVRSRRWILDRARITSHNGNRLGFSDDLESSPSKKFGYFIQNHVRTLDQFGEWAYDAGDNKVTMHFGSRQPSNYEVRASVLENVVFVHDYHYLKFEDLTFEGTTEATMYFYNSRGTEITNCEIMNSGRNGLVAYYSKGLRIKNNRVINTNNTAMLVIYEIEDALIQGNVVRRTGIFHGMSPNGSNTAIGIRIKGENSVIEQNVVDSTGYSAIRFDGNNITIRNNFIRWFSFVKDDGGGIYTDAYTRETHYGRKIINNIIMDGVGAREGSNSMRVQQSSGIYLDNNTAGVDIIGNTVVRCGKLGVYLHNVFNIRMENNLLFDNKGQVELSHDDFDKRQVRNVEMKNNIFLAKTTDQTVAHFYSKIVDIDRFGSIDHNLYMRPLDDDSVFRVVTGLYTSQSVTKVTTLNGWKPMFGHDDNSRKSNKTFPINSDPEDIFHFVYNASMSAVTTAVPGTYVDAYGKQYVGKITLDAYKGAVLMKISDDPGKQDDPVVQVKFTSPEQGKGYDLTSSMLIAADAKVDQGKIDRVEFVTGGRVVDVEKTAPYQWQWSGLEAGSYQVIARAYDEAGNMAADTVSFKIRQRNEAPVVSIFMPSNFEVFGAPASPRIRAAASDDGKINRVEFYHGNTLLDIEYEAPYGMRWFDMQAGTYQVFAKAYDDEGEVTVSEPITIVVRQQDGSLGSIAGNTAAGVNTTLAEDGSVSALGRSGVVPEAGKLKLYPNPAVSELFLTLDGSQLNGAAQISITNASGGLVRTSNVNIQGSNIRVDVSGLLPGSYIVTVKQGAYFLSSKFVKQ